MFTLPRLPVERQHNVGTALEEHFKTRPKYTAEITRGAQAVIEATGALSRSKEMSMFTIDVATDGVLSAVFRILDNYKRGFAARIVPLGPEQRAQLDAANLLEDTWFPDGIGFIHDTHGVQSSSMTSMRRSLTDAETGPALKAAIKTLGIEPLVEHLLVHMGIYAKKLGLAGEVVGNAEARDPSDVWHDLFASFAIDVSSVYRDDPAKRLTLIGSYERQLEEYRAELAKDRKRASKKAKAEADAKAKDDAEARAKAEADAKKED